MLRRNGLILRLPLLALLLVPVVLFVWFFRVGVGGLPVWHRGLDTPSFHNLFDSARYHLSEAEAMLDGLPGVESPGERQGALDVVTVLIEQSLRARPLNPFAWHDRALVSYLEGDHASAVIDLQRSMEFGPYEKILAPARIDLAIRLWAEIDDTQQERIRDQIRWIWGLDSNEVVRLSRLSALHYAVIRGSLVDTPGAASRLDA